MSISFTGGSDRSVNCGSSASIDNIFVSGGSITCWIYPTGWGEGGFGRILNKTEDGVGDNGWAFFVTEISSGFGNASSFTFNHTASPGLNNQITAAAPTSTISLNAWHHCAVTFDKDNINNTPILYHNGLSVTVSTLDSPSGSYDSDAASSLVLGARGVLVIDREFTGSIEDVRMYDRILNPAEILTIYNSRGIDNILSGLVTRWPLIREAVGTVASGAGSVFDISGNNVHATPVGSPTYAESIVRLVRRLING